MYTIKDLSEGKVAVGNDGTLEELQKVLKLAFPKDKYKAEGHDKYYFYASDEKWSSSSTTNVPTQSVKNFLKQEEKPIPRMVMVRDRVDLNWIERELLADLSEYYELEFPYICRDSYDSKNTNGWKYMKEVKEEEPYKVGDKIRIDNENYLISVIENKQVCLISSDGYNWNGLYKVKNTSKITVDEIESMINDNVYEIKYTWKKIN